MTLSSAEPQYQKPSVRLIGGGQPLVLLGWVVGLVGWVVRLVGWVVGLVRHKSPITVISSSVVHEDSSPTCLHSICLVVLTFKVLSSSHLATQTPWLHSHDPVFSSGGSVHVPNGPEIFLLSLTFCSFNLCLVIKQNPHRFWNYYSCTKCQRMGNSLIAE